MLCIVCQVCSTLCHVKPVRQQLIVFKSFSEVGVSFVKLCLILVKPVCCSTVRFKSKGY